MLPPSLKNPKIMAFLKNQTRKKRKSRKKRKTKHKIKFTTIRKNKKLNKQLIVTISIKKYLKVLLNKRKFRCQNQKDSLKAMFQKLLITKSIQKK